ncbi:hypothetical protein ACHQM5_027874 [Ranunculus cassubicifolius]
MKKMGLRFMVVFTVFLLVLESGHSLTCLEVQNDLGPCISYLTGAVPAPSAQCCNGVKHLKAVASTTELRRQTCNCCKQAAALIGNMKDSCIKDLPSKCGTSLSFSISKDMNCNS